MTDILTAVVYSVPVPTASQEEPPLHPKKAQILASLFDVAILAVDAAAINPERGIWGNGPWHPTPGDAILTRHMAWLKAAGLTRQIYKWSSVPAHGTIEGKITFQSLTRGAAPWICDEHGDALVPGRNAFDPALDYVKNPANIDPVWTRQYVEHAVARYGSAFEAWIDFNEPGDGFSYPSIATLDYDAAYQRIWDQVYVPAAEVRRRLGCVGYGPEAAYVDDLRRLLAKQQPRADIGYEFWNLPTFHAYPPPDNATLDGALNELAIRRPIVLELTGKADAWMTEIHDAGSGWFFPYLQQAPSVYPELGMIAWLHSDETLFTLDSIRPELVRWALENPDKPDPTYQLSRWGKVLFDTIQQQKRRRAVTR